MKSLSSHIEVKTTSIYENYGSDIEVSYSHIENSTSISEDLKPQYVSLKVILQDTLNDLFEAGLKNEKLVII